MIISGVYSITNTISGHCYIGSAVNLRVRWLRHQNELENGIHHNGYLQNAWNKYGSGVFRFDVLERVPRCVLIETEQRFVDEMCPEYNINNIVTSPMTGRKHKAESRKKISQSHIGIRPTKTTIEKLINSHKGKKPSDDVRHKMSEASKGKYRGWANKPILQYSKDGILLQRFKSIMDAERITGVGNSKIVRCAKGKRKTSGGFAWKYADNQQAEEANNSGG